MTGDDLREEISIELEQLDLVVGELSSLCFDVAGREPSLREKTAAAAFLAQFYGGVENILKRISRFHGVPLPIGDTWHTDLFRNFCHPVSLPLPPLFDEDLATRMAPYRAFRHIVHHSYGFRMDWERMREGMAGLAGVFARFRTRLGEYLQNM